MSSLRPDHLADYEHPPVIETVLSVQFEPIQNFRLVDFGALWDEFRSGFPKVEEKNPLDATFETFGPRQVHGLKIELADATPLRRVWFVNERETELVQFQIDRLTHNWRKIEVEGKYPRYEAIRASFRGELEKLQEFLHEKGLSQRLQPTQCEITYVNHIAPAGLDNPHRDPGRVLGILAKSDNLPFHEDLEDARIWLRYRLRNQSGEPFGRLHVRADPINAKDGRAVIGLVLTARGRPEPANLDGVFAFFDLGRDRIVTTFTGITSQEMHKEWRRTK